MAQDKAATLTALRAQYEETFGKRARGRYGNDVTWLRKKLGIAEAEPVVEEEAVPAVAPERRARACSLTVVGGESPLRGAGKVRRAPRQSRRGAAAPESLVEIEPESTSVGEEDVTNDTPVNDDAVDHASSDSDSGSSRSRASAKANTSTISNTRHEKRATLSDKGLSDKGSPSHARKGHDKSVDTHSSNSSSASSSSGNVYARLAAGASSWLLADSKPKTTATSTFSARNSSSSSSVTGNARRHEFGSSAQHSTTSARASSFLNFNATTMTKGGRRINVASISNGAKMPWEKSRGVTTFSNASAAERETDDAVGASSTTQKKKPANDKWWELPEQEITPEVRRELEIIKMRNYLNPKRFYKANDSKRLPSRFQFGTIISGAFESTKQDLTRAERRETIAGELMADRRTRKYTRRVFNAVQDERRPPQKKRRKGGRKGRYNKRGGR